MFKHKPIHKTHDRHAKPSHSSKTWDNSSQPQPTHTIQYDSYDFTYYYPALHDSSIEDFVDSLQVQPCQSDHQEFQEDLQPEYDCWEFMGTAQSPIQTISPLQRLNAQYLLRMECQERPKKVCVSFGVTVRLLEFSQEQPVICLQVGQDVQIKVQQYQSGVGCDSTL